MLSQKQLDDIVLRTKRYPFLDGLPDLAMAAMWLSTGVISLLLWDFNLGSAWGVFALMTIPVLILIGMRPLMNTIRSRWLWHESGWVEPQAIGVPRKVYILAGAVWLISGFAARALSDLRLVDDYFLMHMVGVSAGWGTAAFMIASGLYLKLNRYIIAGVLGALAVTPLLFTRFTFGQSLLISGLVWAVLLSITGTLALVSALRKANDRRD